MLCIQWTEKAFVHVVYLSIQILISGPATTVQFDSESSSSLGKVIVKILVWLPV